jgi:hypothetical protein
MISCIKAEAVAFERRAHQHGVFAARRDIRPVQAGNVENVAGLLLDGHEQSQTTPVGVGEPRDELRVECVDRAEETQAKIFGGDVLKEIL